MRKTLVALLLCMALTCFAQPTAFKPRLVVCTDIAPADVEPDDMESMVRLMAYADLFEIEALITSVGWNCDPYPTEWAEYLHRVVNAYGKDVGKLMKRSGQRSFLPLAKENERQTIGYWPSADYMAGRVAMGSQRGGIGALGESNDSPGSNLLIRLADEADDRPIYVAAWGGANTLAQAVWRVKQTRTPDELKRFLHKFRIFTITDQDMQYSMRMNRAYSSHQWLRREFSDDLLFIWDEGAWQEQCELGKRHWNLHRQHVQGKGALGKEYPDYKWGVEGDTPSFLYVMPHGLNDPDDPSQAGWAGYHQRGVCPDSLTTAWTSWQEPVRSISVGYKKRFYADEIADFMARMQWADKGRGNRNPHVDINGDTDVKPLLLHVRAGETVRLDASRSSDPDGDHLAFHWWMQPELGEGGVAVVPSDDPVVNVRIPHEAPSTTYHLICEVHDDGPFHLVAYRRVILDVTASHADVKAHSCLMPAALKAGDTIAIVSPSSVPDSVTLVRGCTTLRQWGYVPVVGVNAKNNYHGFAGTADERAEDLLWALRTPSVKAIMCSRGGDGAVQALERIPLEEFSRHPKWLMGFSDVTALHSAEVAAGVMSIHCTMCDGIYQRGESDSVNLMLRRLLQGQLPVCEAPAHPLNQQGEATGMLVGGNLSVFCGLAASDYDFLNRADEGLILFFEDTSEPMSKVDRMLHLLEVRGILPKLKGIIVGHFSKYKSPENGFADMYDMLHEYLQHYDIPVCYDFPVGHHSGQNYPMVEGCQVRLTVGPNGTRLQFE